jgi:hypothetical protein
MTTSETRVNEVWLALRFNEWRDTCVTLQLYRQIVGKVRLALTPWINHSWHATFYVTARGLTTSLMPYASRSFEIELQARRFWRVLVQVDRVLARFSTRFIGKVSPIHLFWGSFDLAVTRFSGRRAPLHPGGVPGLPDAVTREAYSHEVSSAGFWPGGGSIADAAFYSYAYPAPEGYDAAGRVLLSP